MSPQLNNLIKQLRLGVLTVDVLFQAAHQTLVESMQPNRITTRVWTCLLVLLLTATLLTFAELLVSRAVRAICFRRNAHSQFELSVLATCLTWKYHLFFFLDDDCHGG